MLGDASGWLLDNSRDEFQKGNYGTSLLDYLAGLTVGLNSILSHPAVSIAMPPAGVVMATGALACEGAIAAEGAEGFATLYRTVGEGERAAIGAASRYEPALGGVEGKYFYPTAEQATSLARANFSSQGVQTLTSVRVPNAVLGGATRLSVGGEGRAIFFTGEQLPTLGTPQVWNYFPIGAP